MPAPRTAAQPSTHVEPFHLHLEFQGTAAPSPSSSRTCSPSAGTSRRLDAHQNGTIDLGPHAEIDYRILQVRSAQVYPGIEGIVTADPTGGGGANVTFAPAFSIEFGGSVHPPAAYH